MVDGAGGDVRAFQEPSAQASAAGRPLRWADRGVLTTRVRLDQWIQPALFGHKTPTA
jgi:hypothetical protein